MNARMFALVSGVVYLLVGLLGFFINGGTSLAATPADAPRLLGLFPVNVLHNLVHLAFGLWGVVASRSFGGAKSYLYGAGVIYLVLAALGYIAPEGFGLVPLGGNDIGLHLFLGLGLLLSGMVTARRDAATV